MEKPIGHRRWAIAEGHIMEQGPTQEFAIYETACILNTAERDAHVKITVYFSDRAPAGPYRVTVPAHRTRHVRFNDLDDPEPIPRGTDYASTIESDVAVVVQHTRYDSRQAENAQISTIAFPSVDYRGF